MKLILAGFGTVGQGVAKILKAKNNFIKSRFDEGFEIVGVSDSKGAIYDSKGLNLDLLLKIKQEKGMINNYPGAKILDSNEELIDEDADVLIEMTPTDIKTGGAGMSNMLGAFKTGKHVVTSNKGPLALNFKCLKNESTKNGCLFYYDATVGGATPIISLAKELLTRVTIKSFQGILNGTCNYILSRMTKEEAPFELILREAQQLGYAEADPTYDVDGIDAACKLVILANSIMETDATLKNVKVKGIRKITEDAVKLAKKDGKVIKLIGEIGQGKLEVCPRLVPKGHLLDVSGTLNVGLFRTDFAGEIAIVGRGAGQMETASTILKDLIAILRAKHGNM